MDYLALEFKIKFMFSSHAVASYFEVMISHISQPAALHNEPAKQITHT